MLGINKFALLYQKKKIEQGKRSDFTVRFNKKYMKESG
jgi:hypothetical protein